MAEIKKITWRSPSNIAIVKYWGKYGLQQPMNPSLSFTLDKCYTETSIEYEPGSGIINFQYEGKPKLEFESKVYKFIKGLELDFLKKLDLNIDSKNTFPHSAGIASSASAMSALSLCLTDLEGKLEVGSEEFNRVSSTRSRIGSGSACRSIYPKAALWGNFIEALYSSNDYAIDWSPEINEEFLDIQDWIIIVNQFEKSVSSSAGHQLMLEHPFRYSRIEQAKKNIARLIGALKMGDWNEFINICEEEALSLHALMMSSNPGYVLLEPDSIRIIKSIRKLREETKYPVCFTIDAGPNIHILFPSKYSSFMTSWLMNEFPEYVSDSKVIFDQIGNGPKKMS